MILFMGKRLFVGKEKIHLSGTKEGKREEKGATEESATGVKARLRGRATQNASKILGGNARKQSRKVWGGDIPSQTP